jgi:plasmid stabilization system protein ParE
MARRLVVRPHAESDIESTYEWYEDQREGLGAEFLAELEAGFSRVVRNPEVYATVQGSIRRALLRRFPFGVFFLVSDDLVSVIAVFHTSRDPKTLRRRPQ